ncbi:putative hydrolase of the HAD superfamily [Streptomyces sp. DvalAA-14]|uniref:HAD-IA family hydrolase n=1 Tax=unclassified Streptomyces TaxID=2593676 RepID=UPI00081B56D1|nr:MULTISPECIES: HAD-IA family hydrolase [unclassified Streptomyces]MYS21880.1 HAD-IA family hydrolase [Streptomyces sp. SID4948]SCE03087.1 putative hydrolase of the HAD superfamily [Streptomyces sp. DvalAA-14]
MSRPAGLILDFAGVLTTEVAAAMRGFDRRTGLPDGTFRALVSEDPQGRALYEDLERGAITQAEWNTRTAALLGVDSAGLLGRVLRDLRPQPAMIAAARTARAAGIRVGILSNSLGPGPFDLYAGYELSADYDAVVISQDYRLRKPDPAIYRIMLGLMELPGGDCVFVDDTAHNLPPAGKLGITTVLAQDPPGTIARIEELFGVRLINHV